MRDKDFQKHSHFVAINTTFGTTLAINKDPIAINDEEAMIVLDNSASRTVSPTHNIIVVPKQIKMWCTTTAASATDFGILVKLDNIARWSSGGILLTSKQPYIDTASGYSARAAVGKAYFGDITAVAESASVVITGQDWPHLITNGCLDGNSYTWVFEDSPGAAENTAATLKQYRGSLPIQYIGPGCSMVIHPFATAAATTGAKFHVQVEWMELNQPYTV